MISSAADTLQPGMAEFSCGGPLHTSCTLCPKTGEKEATTNKDDDKDDDMAGTESDASTNWTPSLVETYGGPGSSGLAKHHKGKFNDDQLRKEVLGAD